LATGFSARDHDIAASAATTATTFKQHRAALLGTGASSECHAAADGSVTASNLNDATSRVRAVTGASRKRHRSSA
jgi:hypothetical protein